MAMDLTGALFFQDQKARCSYKKMHLVIAPFLSEVYRCRDIDFGHVNKLCRLGQL
jgi:hypothetical protein